MVILTDQAATAIRMLTANPQAPAGAGLRITGHSLELAVAPPDSEDTVIESAGALLCLDPTAAAALDHKALHARSDEDGRLHFVVTNQPPATTPDGSDPFGL